MKAVTVSKNKTGVLYLMPSLAVIVNDYDWGLHFNFLYFHAWAVLPRRKVSSNLIASDRFIKTAIIVCISVWAIAAVITLKIA